MVEAEVKAIKISHSPRVRGLSAKNRDNARDIRRVKVMKRCICETRGSLGFRIQIPAYLYTNSQGSSSVDR